MDRDLRFWALHALLPLALFLALALLFEVSDLDLAFSDPFYDPVTGSWPLKRSWWAAGLIHRGGRNLVLAVAIGALLAWGASFRWPPLLPWRRAALFMVLAIVIGTGGVSLGKRLINRHCPWDYDRYGGAVPYTRLLQGAPEGCRDGDCFPAGHASGGFALMGSYFAFRGRSRRAALGGLLAGLALGTLFAVGQQVRGAHFVSHNLWSAAWCWFACLALDHFGFRRGQGGVHEQCSPIGHPSKG